MANDPYMPLFVGDFLGATILWSGPERGLYLHMLAVEWSAGPLPAEPEKLAHVLGYKLEDFERLWPTVSEKFDNNGGRLTNAKLERVRVRSTEISASRHGAAVAAAQARWSVSDNGGGPSGTPRRSARRNASRITQGNASVMPSNPIQSTNKPKSTRATAREVQLPVPGLDQAAWDRWSAYRIEIGKRLRSTSIEAAQRSMAALGSEQAAAVQHSISNGYTGLIAPRRSPVDLAEQKRQRGLDASWARVKNHAAAIGCPLQPHEHDSPDTFESRVKSWETHSPRAPGGPTPITKLLAGKA